MEFCHYTTTCAPTPVWHSPGHSRHLTSVNFVEKTVIESLAKVTSRHLVANLSLYPLAHSFKLSGAIQSLWPNFETVYDELVRLLHNEKLMLVFKTIMTFAADRNTSISLNLAKFSTTTCSSTYPWMECNSIGTRSQTIGSE